MAGRIYSTGPNCIMIANIIDNQWVYLEHITDHEDQVLWKEFSICKPNMYIDPMMRGSWDGIYRKYNRAKKRIARPLLRMLRSVCKKHDLPLTVCDQRQPWLYNVEKPVNINSEFLSDIKLEEYQIRAIRYCCQTECGVIDMPTGSGKCVCFESKIYIEGLGEIQIGTLFDGFRDEEYRLIDGLRVRYPGGIVDVTALYKTNKRQIMRLELESGHWLRGVPEHRIMTRRGWIMLKDLTIDDEVAIDG